MTADDPILEMLGSHFPGLRCASYRDALRAVLDLHPANGDQWGNTCCEQPTGKPCGTRVVIATALGLDA